MLAPSFSMAVFSGRLVGNCGRLTAGQFWVEMGRLVVLMGGSYALPPLPRSGDFLFLPAPVVEVPRHPVSCLCQLQPLYQPPV